MVPSQREAARPPWFSLHGAMWCISTAAHTGPAFHPLNLLGYFTHIFAAHMAIIDLKPGWEEFMVAKEVSSTLWNTPLGLSFLFGFCNHLKAGYHFQTTLPVCALGLPVSLHFSCPKIHEFRKSLLTSSSCSSHEQFRVCFTGSVLDSFTV